MLMMHWSKVTVFIWGNGIHGAQTLHCNVKHLLAKISFPRFHLLKSQNTIISFKVGGERTEDWKQSGHEQCLTGNIAVQEAGSGDQKMLRPGERRDERHCLSCRSKQWITWMDGFVTSITVGSYILAHDILFYIHSNLTLQSQLVCCCSYKWWSDC